MVFVVFIILIIITVIVVTLIVSSHNEIDSEYSKSFSDNKAVRLWINNGYDFSCEQMKDYLHSYGVRKIDTEKLLSEYKNPLSYKQKKFVLKHKDKIEMLFQMYEIDKAVQNDLAKELWEGKRRQYYASFISSKRASVPPVEPYTSMQSPTGEMWPVSVISYPKKYCLDHLEELDLYIIEEEERRVKEEIERKKIFAKVSEKLSSWGKIGTIPHYFFYWYYPKNRWGDNVTPHSQHVRNMIYDFKDGHMQKELSNAIYDKLYQLYRWYIPLDEIVFVCVPASNQDRHKIRYKSFMDSLCTFYPMTNGYHHVKITSSKQPLVKTNSVKINYEIDKDWFNGKYIMIFDDIVTRGDSIKQFASILQDAGATVVCALSIGKTIHGQTPLPDPWEEEDSE